MSPELYIAYVFACIVFVIVPGPNVTLIIANSLTHGTRAGLLNIAGSQLAGAIMIGIVLVGLTSVIETMGLWFDWIRFAGAAYLVWLGWKLLRSSGDIGVPGRTPKPRGGFFLQGFLVMASNPKALLFFGAFIPQFVDARGAYVGQVTLLGITTLIVAALSDSVYAVLVGRAGLALSRQRVRLISRISGGFLIGGGVWLALARVR